uniref:phage NrS-1 polymerase family protein n=1 Tax=Haloprofundus sp. MHR1 TaxID=2572921 RepID=UPI0031B823A3
MVCWRSEQRGEKSTKIPVESGVGSFASSTDSETWSDFETALEYLQSGGADGLGFVFTDEDPIVGVDLDDCRDPESGEVDEDAQDIIEKLDSYTEVSPSGSGFHVLVQGELPEGRNRRGKIECYDNARFFTVTGEHVESTPAAVERRQDALEAVHREYISSASESQSRHSPKTVTANETESSVEGVGLSDPELVEKAMGASNGAKFGRLWNGNTSGYDSNSEADMALCCLLAFWSGGDESQMDRLFRRSGLLRGKWDDVHYADGSTYGEKTIERAVQTTSEFYTPAKKETTKSVSEPSESPRASEGRDDAYVGEKNRLLAERVETLERRIKRKDKRIEWLEAEIQRLEARLQDDDTESVSGEESQHVSNDGESGSASLWRRTKRLLGTDAE